MDKLFLTVLNMSITGAFVIAAICLARLPLKKAPKIISYCLWAVAGFRLVFPYSIESMFSLIPFNSAPVPPDIAMQAVPRIESGIPFVNNAVSSVLPAAAPMQSANPLQIWIGIGTAIWLFGVAVMVAYGIVSYIILKRKMRNAVCAEGNIYEADNIKSPFVLGVFKPRIYLPFGLGETERGYILLHEQTHIRRRDHVIKFGAYFILCLHWFNPLVWIAFSLMGADMEMSCDERVLKEMGGETKKDYSMSLLSLATERSFVGGSPLAFGESGVKERIKNVLNFKNPSRVIISAAVVLALVLSIGCAVNRVSKEPLIEFEVIYGDVNEYSFSSQFKLNDIVYSPYIDDDFLGGTWGLKEIGFAVGDLSGTVREGQRHKYRVFERKGYPIDEFIIVEDDGLMNPATIYAAETVSYGLVAWKSFGLENATQQQMMERMVLFTLYEDGTMSFAAAMISSYIPPPCTYSIENGEMVFRAVIETEQERSFFGLENGDIVAKFAVIDENTLVFTSASIALFAEPDGRYVAVYP